MKPNLDKLKPEIEGYVEQAGLVLFYGYARSLESHGVIYWDCDQYPDFKMFVDSAQAAEAKMIVFHQRQFFAEQIEDALERLAGCELPAEDARGFERRLNELRVHEGSVCAIELSFDHQGRVFVFELETDWYQELSEILDEIQLLTADSQDDDTPMSGYFSRN
jgi:hypothetical protein